MYDNLDFYLDEEKKLLFECLSALKERYRVSKIPDAERDRITASLGEFVMLRGSSSLELGNAWTLDDGTYRCTYCVLVSVSRYRGVTRHAVHYDVDRRQAHQLVTADLGVDFGHVLMRPERLADKLSELFSRREVDFPEHPLFSGKYYVLTDDEERLRETASWEFLHEIASYDALTIEIVRKTWIAARHRGLNYEDALDIAGASFDVQKALDGPL